MNINLVMQTTAQWALKENNYWIESRQQINF